MSADIRELIKDAGEHWLAGRYRHAAHLWLAAASLYEATREWDDAEDCYRKAATCCDFAAHQMAEQKPRPTQDMPRRLQ